MSNMKKKATQPLIILTSCLLVIVSGCMNSPKEATTANEGLMDTLEYVVAPVGPQNTRNSEAAIVPLKDGLLLLAWTEFYGNSGEDHAPARIVGKISLDEGSTWGE